MQRRAVLFDLFHTLTAVEAVPGNGGPGTSEILGVSREAWNAQLLGHSRDRLTGVVRDPVEIVRRMARAIDPSIPEEAIRAAAARRAERFARALLEPPAETLEMLRSLRGPLGLVSNADASEAAAWPRSPLAPLFASAVFSCDAGAAKPDPEIYLACVRALGVRADECVFVGDGGSDEMAGAKRLGMATVLYRGLARRIWPDRAPASAPAADVVVDELGGLREAVE